MKPTKRQRAHEHAPHGPIVSKDANGNEAQDLHGWGHPLGPAPTPLRDRIPLEPARGIVHDWRRR